MFLLAGATFAQGTPAISGRADSERLTPEQRNQLHLKKMTAELGLNASQQKDMAQIMAEQSTRKEAMKAQRKAQKENKVKLTADERFKKQNEMLDHRIAMKARVKQILTPQQFEKWETKSQNRQHKMKKHVAKEKHKSVKRDDIRK